MFITILGGFSILTMLSFGDLVISCPIECTCSGKFADCYSRNLKEFPSDLPAMTEILDIQNNEIEMLPKKSFNKLKNLKELKLRFNKIRVIEPGTFRKMTKLKKLDLAANFITSLPNRIFSGANELTHLDLSENYLERIDNIFSGLTNLERLDLGNNAIREITNNSFRDLRQLLFLILSNNNISSIQKNAFKNLNLLSYLVMRNNPIRKLDDLLAKNIRLTYVEFANCQLEYIPRGLPWMLRYLQLSENNITRINASDLLPYKFLGILVVDENQISYIEDEAFSHMNLLQDLWLNVNRLTHIPQSLPRGLKSLYLDQNNIQEIATNDIPFATKLEVLSLRDNELQEINYESFRNPGFLKKLFLNGNNFTIIENSTFSHLPHLKSLSLNRNSLKSIEVNAFSGLDSLDTLGMSSIHASENCLKGNIFKGLKNLKILDVQLSPQLAMSILESASILNSLMGLEEINLMDNHIKTISTATGKFFTDIKKIKLAENKFHCDENLIWLKNWIAREEDRFFLSVDVTCYTPVNLRGRQLTSLMDEEFITAFNEETTSAVTKIDTQTIQDMDGHYSENKIITDVYPTEHSQPTMAKSKFLENTEATLRGHSTFRYNLNTTAMSKTTETTTKTTFQIQTEKPKSKITRSSTQGSQHATSKSLGAKTKKTTVPSASFTTVTMVSTTKKQKYTHEPKTIRDTSVMRYKTSTKMKIPTSASLSVKEFLDEKKTWRSVLTTLTPTSNENKDIKKEHGLKVTAIVTTISVIVFVFISLAAIYFIYAKRKKLVYHRARKYQDDGDVVFYITDSEGLKTIPSSSKLTREDRGSVTSRPSEDIMNDYDPEMKVYTWDDD